MAYSYEQCLRDLEQILNRPINPIECQYASSWFDNYPQDHIHTCMEICKGRGVYRASYVSNVLASHYAYYQAYMRANGVEEATPIIATPKVEEIKPKENVDKEALDKFMALMDDEE